MSAALKRLEELRYIQRDETPQDRRKKYLLLTEQGQRAMVATSVLDAQRILELLSELDPAARRSAVDGLTLLAGAVMQMKSRLRRPK